MKLSNKKPASIHELADIPKVFKGYTYTPLKSGDFTLQDKSGEYLNNLDTVPFNVLQYFGVQEVDEAMDIGNTLVLSLEKINRVVYKVMDLAKQNRGTLFNMQLKDAAIDVLNHVNILLEIYSTEKERLAAIKVAASETDTVADDPGSAVPDSIPTPDGEQLP